jgi:cell division protein FtsW
MLKKSELAGNSHHDFALLASTLVLVSLGLTMVFISSTVMANAQYQDPYFFVKRQSVYALLGVGALVLGRTTDYHVYKRYAYWVLLAALIGLVLVFVPHIGAKVRGSARWLSLRSSPNWPWSFSWPTPCPANRKK